MSTAVLYGLLFGAIAYCTYDLTNYATLRNWNLQLTILDVAYGALATAAAAAAATPVARMATTWAVARPGDTQSSRSSRDQNARLSR